MKVCFLPVLPPIFGTGIFQPSNEASEKLLLLRKLRKKRGGGWFPTETKAPMVPLEILRGAENSRNGMRSWGISLVRNISSVGSRIAPVWC